LRREGRNDSTRSKEVGEPEQLEVVVVVVVVMVMVRVSAVPRRLDL